VGRFVGRNRWGCEFTVLLVSAVLDEADLEYNKGVIRAVLIGKSWEEIVFILVGCRGIFDVGTS